MVDDEHSETARFMRWGQSLRRYRPRRRQTRWRRTGDAIKYFLATYGAGLGWLLATLQLLGVDLKGWIGSLL